MSQELRVTLLGEPQILCDGTPLTGFISSKSQALLMYLAATGQPHSRETLATLFWDEMAESSAKKNLTKALSNLRKLLGNYIQSDNQSASLNWSLTPWVDLQSFQQSITTDLASADLSALQQSVDLYQGDLLSGFIVKDAPLFEEWLWMERERLHQLAVQSMFFLAEQFTATNDDIQAIHYLRRLLILDPLYEPAHLQLMLGLARSGQRKAALAQFETCKKLLADELGVEPNTALQETYQKLKKAGTPPPHNIPPQPPIVGRTIETDEIVELLTEPGCRLLTIVGPGGIGKTRLALHAASTFMTIPEPSLAQFPDGIYFISLAPLNQIDVVLAALAKTVDFSFQEEEAPGQQLLNYLQGKQVLLVLDNFEHLLAGRGQPLVHSAAGPAPHSHGNQVDGLTNLVSFVTTLLDAAPELKILVTSRIRLNVQAEHTFHLTGMEVPLWAAEGVNPAKSLLPESGTKDPKSPNMIRENPTQLASYGAIQLFLQSARRLRPNFELTAENQNAVVQICQRVQGMPLGLLLAASWITVLTPHEILAEISSSFDLLETQESDVPLRQRSVRAAFEYTWQMLAQREQEVYKKLSLFRGDFTRQAAQKVAGATLRELMIMVDKSLLAPSRGGRFALHELLRQFGLEKLHESLELEQSVRDQHCLYFAQQMSTRAVDFHGAEQERAQQETEDESENIRAAWQWAIDNGYIHQLVQMVDGLCQFYVWRGRFQEGQAIAQQSVAKLKEVITDSPSAILANNSPHNSADNLNDNGASVYVGAQTVMRLLIESLIWQGVFSRYLGKDDEAVELLEESLALFNGKGVMDKDLQAERAFALLQLGETIRERDKEVAKEYYDECLALYRATGNQWGAANALNSLGWLIQHGGGYNDARHLYQESLTIRQTIDDRRGMASSLRSVGGVALYQGDLEQAAQLIRESIVLSQALNDRAGTAASYGKLGETLISLGKFQDAEQPLIEAMTIYSELGLLIPTTFIKTIHGLAHLHMGHYDLARTQAEEALETFQQQNAQRGVAYASLILGWAMLAQQSSTQTSIFQAQHYLEAAHSLYEILGQQDELGQTHALLGLVALLNHNRDSASHHLQKAQSIAEQIQAYMPRVLALAIQTFYSGEQLGKPDQVWVHTQVAHQPIVASSRWFATLLGRLVEGRRVDSRAVASKPAGL